MIGDVDMNIQRQSVQSLLQRVENEASRTNPLSPSIFMVPSILRDVSPDSFNPRLVSIGPLHKEDVNVQAFEVQKVRYMNNLILRINDPQQQILESCMEKAYTSMNEIKACYVGTKTYTDPEIAEMMVLDACFMLEFMFELYIYLSSESNQGNEFQFRTVLRDLVLLENQIPLFFLEEIFRCTILKFKPNFSLIELISPVLYSHNLFEKDLNIDNASISTAHHILSLLHQCYKPPYDIKESLTTVTEIHSAIDLDMAGVNFKPSKDPTWVMGMEVKQYSFPYFFRYWSKTTLTMPVLKIDDYTERLLRNLIAYEESFQTKSYVTSFVTAMDMLINTQEDVSKLVESKVLVNIMGSNKEAANMINSICKNVTICSFYEEEWEKLNKYCNFFWPKQIARMRRKYFSSPWSIIALLAGIILFVLQVVQTIFTIKSSGSSK